MRVEFPQSFDFNQMLVFSVFVHLLFLTIVMFLPKPSYPGKTVVPAFMVNLVSEPTGFKKAGSKRSELKARAKKKSVEKKAATKKSPISKPAKVKKSSAIKTPKTNGVLEALNKLEGKMALATPNVVEELAQVARLETSKIKPSPPKPDKQKPINEETIRDLEALKNKSIKEKKTIVPVPPPPTEILEDVEVPEIEESLPETPASLAKLQESVSESKEPEKPKAPKRDLLQELEQVAKLDASPVLVPDLKAGEPEPVERIEKSSESYDPIIEKLSSFSIESEPINVEVSNTRLDSSSFQSKLRTLPRDSQVTDESETENSHVFTKKEGPTGADAQSLYVGMIQEKIFKNWREPLAEKHNQEVVVSFFIFPSGNIDKPFIKKSSGVEALNTLAVRAVLDSVPFPEFPRELKMSNLHINIYFKYVPKD